VLLLLEWWFTYDTGRGRLALAKQLALAGRALAPPSVFYIGHLIILLRLCIYTGAFRIWLPHDRETTQETYKRDMSRQIRHKIRLKTNRGLDRLTLSVLPK
jgi:hypothetical protein